MSDGLNLARKWLCKKKFCLMVSSDCVRLIVGTEFDSLGTRLKNLFLAELVALESCNILDEGLDLVPCSLNLTNRFILKSLVGCFLTHNIRPQVPVNTLEVAKPGIK